MKQKTIIILASGSPRRRQLLQQAGLEFEVVVSDVEEKITKTAPEEVVLELSEQKCNAVSDEFIRKTFKTGGVEEENVIKSVIDLENGRILVIGADTVVTLDGRILGKPSDAKEALSMLMSLSGRSHKVYTGVTCNILAYNSFAEIFMEIDKFSFYSETLVNMYPFNEYEALDYIATGEPMDKAGAYGIQGIGERLVESINGDYNNVVGFPLSRFMKELSEREYISYE